MKHLKKIRYYFRPKCLNGIKELNIECDGRAIICQMGNNHESAYTGKTCEDHGFNLKNFFNSGEVRRKRLNCQTCPINCQQHIYFNPTADNLFQVFYKFLTILPRAYKIWKIQNEDPRMQKQP